MPDNFERVVLWWGPGILLLMVFGYGFLRLAHYWIDRSMGMKSKQMEGAFGLGRQYIEQFLGTQKSQADALSRLASSVEHRESVESFEHQEILIALKALHRDIDTLYCRRGEPPCGLPRDPIAPGGHRTQVAASQDANPVPDSSPAPGSLRRGAE